MFPSIPTSSPFTPSLEPVVPIVNSRRVQSVALADLRPLFASLAEEHPRPGAYLHAVMRTLLSQHRHVCISLNGRIAAETLNDFACANEFELEQQKQLRELTSQAARNGLGDSVVQVTGPYALVGKSLYLVVLPVISPMHSELLASFCVAIAPSDSSEIKLRAHELTASLLLAIQALPVSAKPSPQQFDSTLQTTAKVCRYGDTREFAYALVNSVAKRFSGEQVALGIVSNQQLSVWAVSGTDDFKASSPGIIDIQQAMEEARDVQSSIVCQPEGQSAKLKSMPIHVRWSASTQSAVCSIPLMAGNACVAVLSIRRHRRLGISEADLNEIEQVIKPFGPAIELSLRGDRTLQSHLRDTTFKSLAKLRDPETKAGRIARNVAIGVALVLLLGWFPYRPLTPCTLVPANLTQTLASFDMQLRDVYVRSGDRVTKGQVLAKFDTRQLELERAGLFSQLEQSEIDVRKALLKHDAASASLSKAASQVFATQLAAVEKKIEQCTITAPADGMVMDAELNRKVGQVFPQGSPILSFAPLDKWQLEIQVPESQASHFQVDQVGSFAPESSPGRKLNYRITSIAGAAELIAGKNVVVATAEVEGDAEFFKQGMAGIARTYTGWKPIPWLLLHRLVEYGRAGFWM